MPEQTESRPALAEGALVDRDRGEPVAGVPLAVHVRLDGCTHDVATGISDAEGRFTLADQAQELAAIRAAGAGPVELDFAKVPYPAAEQNRRVTNVFVALPGSTGPTVSATLDLTGAAAAFTCEAGIALSNGEPLRLPGSPSPDQPLNAAIGEPVEQPWRFTLSPDPGADLTGLQDLVVGIEYAADPL